MAEMSELSELALDYLFGDRSVVRQLDVELRAVTAGPEGCGGRG